MPYQPLAEGSPPIPQVIDDPEEVIEQEWALIVADKHSVGLILSIVSLLIDYEQYLQGLMAYIITDWLYGQAFGIAPQLEGPDYPFLFDGLS